VAQAQVKPVAVEEQTPAFIQGDEAQESYTDWQRTPEWPVTQEQLKPEEDDVQEPPLAQGLELQESYKLSQRAPE